MTTLGHYSDGSSTCYANLVLDSGEPVFISVSQTGIMVKRSRTGLMGKKLYKAGFEQSARTCQALDSRFGETPVDPGIKNPALRAFVQATLNASTANELQRVLSQ